MEKNNQDGGETNDRSIKESVKKFKNPISKNERLSYVCDDVNPSAAKVTVEKERSWLKTFLVW
jgi:hypothetical protein